LPRGGQGRDRSRILDHGKNWRERFRCDIHIEGIGLPSRVICLDTKKLKKG